MFFSCWLKKVNKKFDRSKLWSRKSNYCAFTVLNIDNSFIFRISNWSFALLVILWYTGGILRFVFSHTLCMTTRLTCQGVIVHMTECCVTMNIHGVWLECVFKILKVELGLVCSCWCDVCIRFGRTSVNKLWLTVD